KRTNGCEPIPNSGQWVLAHSPTSSCVQSHKSKTDQWGRTHSQLGSMGPRPFTYLGPTSGRDPQWTIHQSPQSSPNSSSTNPTTNPTNTTRGAHPFTYLGPRPPMDHPPFTPKFPPNGPSTSHLKVPTITHSPT